MLMINDLEPRHESEITTCAVVVKMIHFCNACITCTASTQNFLHSAELSIHAKISNSGRSEQVIFCAQMVIPPVQLQLGLVAPVNNNPIHCHYN